ncbi:MAG TPA: bestrophin family protein [Ohtaekwangia sp.]|uniref:bestrophin family protein n=1 Tax=Ohtaekwangia sp. TaxID=2066019 RepID=UPI002F92C45C
MVNYNPKTWIALILHSYSRHVLKTMLPAILVMAIFTGVSCYIILDYFELKPSEFPGTTTVHSLLGIVLGLFLVFRTNSAYDRWWEGRRQWGGVVNSSRNLALKLNAYLSADNQEDRAWFARMIPNFVFAMKEHLRAGVKIGELDVNEAEASALEKVEHKPNKISAMLYSKVNQLYKANVLTGDQLINLDKELKDLIDLIGACERIKNTPIPYSYSMFIKKFIFIYIVTLPFGFVITFEYFTIPTVMLVSYVLLSVELIAEEIEDPFGKDINDLPTDELAKRIKKNIHEIMR